MKRKSLGGYVRRSIRSFRGSGTYRGMRYAAGLAAAARVGKSLYTSFRTRFKGKPSRTKTKTKPKQLKNELDESKGGTNYENHRIVVNRKPVSGVSRKGGKTTFNWNLSQEGFVATTGTQNAEEMFAVGTKNQWFDTSGNTNIYYQSPTRWFDLNPNQANTGSAALGTQTSGMYMDRFALIECIVNMGITNMSNISSNIKLYFVRAKKPCKSSPTACWQNGYANSTFAGGNSVTALGASNYGIIGANPGEVKEFNEYWSIIKVLRVDLAGANSSKEFTFKFVMNQLGKSESLKGDDLDYNFPQGSLVCFAVTYGQVVANEVDPIYVADRGRARWMTVMNLKAVFKPVYGNSARLTNHQAYVYNSRYDGNDTNDFIAGENDDVKAVVGVI